MSDMPTASSPELVEEHARIPADNCHWTLLDAPPSAMKRPGLLPIGLLADAQSEFPVPLEDLHAIAAPQESGRIVVCAIALDVLQSHRGVALTLTPDTVPSEFGVSADTSTLNFLVGEYQPAAIRITRWRRDALVTATLTICSVLIAIGFSRRMSHLNGLATADTLAAEQVLAAATPDSREQTLFNQLEQARRFAALARREKPLRDAAADFESLLAAWPQMHRKTGSTEGAAEVAVKPQSLSVLSDGANIAVTVEGGNAAAAAFLKAFTPPAAFTLDEPRLASVGSITRLNLHLRHAKPVTGGQGGTP